MLYNCAIKYYYSMLDIQFQVFCEINESKLPMWCCFVFYLGHVSKLLKVKKFQS